MNRFASLVVLAVLLAACATVPGAGGSVDGREFLSTNITGYTLVDGTQIRLSFTDGNKIGASAGCNIFGGDYRISDGRLTVTGGAMTEMACTDDRMAQDDWLFGFLGSEPSMALDGEQLTLTGGGVVITLTDREVADPDRPLVGTTWTLTGLIEGDAVSSIPDTVVSTLMFHDNGRVDIQPACNDAGGEYAVDGDTIITFGEIVTTEMHCTDARGEVEEAVMAVLSAGDVTYTIDAGGMTLTAGDIGLTYSAP